MGSGGQYRVGTTRASENRWRKGSREIDRDEMKGNK
jgi:hypothetical protein